MRGQLTRGSPCSLPSLGSLLCRPPRGHPSPGVQHPGNQDTSLQLCCPGGLGWGYKLGLRCLLDRPQGPPPSTLFASDAFFHFPRPPAPLGGPQPQLRGLFTGSHHPGPRGVLCRPRLGLSSQGQGSFPPGTLLFWPTLSPSANSNPRVGAHQGLEMGAVIPPAEEPPGLEATVGFTPEGGACFWLEGRGPLSPPCTKHYVIKTPFLHSWSTGTPNLGSCAHCKAHQQGRLLPTPCLTVHQPAQTQSPCQQHPRPISPLKNSP